MDLSQTKLKVEYWAPSDLLPYERNARLHSGEQVAQIAASILEFGFTNPLLIDDRNMVIAGHGRLAAAHHLQLTEVPTITLRGLTDQQRRALTIADNKLALNASWDEALLTSELGDLRGEGYDVGIVGFSTEELDELPVDEDRALPNEDRIPEPPPVPASRTGDLWLLGGHRLLCGDSTKSEQVRQLMNGERAILFATDPPYLVDYDGTNHPSKKNHPDKNKDWCARTRRRAASSDRRGGGVPDRARAPRDALAAGPAPAAAADESHALAWMDD